MKICILLLQQYEEYGSKSYQIGQYLKQYLKIM